MKSEEIISVKKNGKEHKIKVKKKRKNWKSMAQIHIQYLIH